jgi:hypothetical protein
MPLLYPSKGKISTSDQVHLYQMMNSLARPKNVEQLLEALWWRIMRKHNRVHGCQRSLITIDRFSNMLSAILQKNNGAATPRINP